MGTTEEALRTEREARRALAERSASSRHSDAIARYLAAVGYADGVSGRRGVRHVPEDPDTGDPSVEE